MTIKHYNELLQKYGERELAENFVFAVKLESKQKKEANDALMKELNKRRAGMSQRNRLKGELLQLRYEIEDCLKDKDFDKKKNFSYFLKSYIKRWDKKNKEFAREISITPAVLSQYTNSFRKPTEDVMVRLEIHSNNIIPAVRWYQLLEKEKIHKLNSNKSLRNKQRTFVHGVMRFAK